MSENTIIQDDLEQNNLKKDKKQQSESQKAMNGILGGFAIGLLFGLGAWGISQFYIFLICKIIFWLLIFCAVVCGMVSISCFFDWKAAKKVEKIEAEAREEEKEFSEIDLSKRELRAERMFKINQKELMRYYDTNLAQTKFLSTLGIIMIFLGILIVLISLGMYVYWELDTIILFVGSISGIVVDFVGAIFIKMYTQNIEAAVRFHAKLAESNNLLLANSIAHKISDDELREQTLSDISKGIVVMHQITAE